MTRLLKNHPKALSFYFHVIFTVASILLWPGKKLLNHLVVLELTYLSPPSSEAIQAVDESIVVTVDEVTPVTPEVTVKEEEVAPPVEVALPAPPKPTVDNSELLNAIKIIQKHLTPEEKPQKTLNPPMVDKKFVEAAHARILSFRNNKLQSAPVVHTTNDNEFDYSLFVKNSHARIRNHRVKASEHKAEERTSVVVPEVSKSPFFEVNYDVSKLNLNKPVAPEVMVEKSKQPSIKSNIKVKRKG